VLQLRQNWRNSSNWLFPFRLRMECRFWNNEAIYSKITLEVLENRLPQGVVLNVNFPKLTRTTSKESKYVVKQSTLDRKFDKRQTPQGRDYYWLAGEFVNQDKGEDTDEWALGNGYVFCSSSSVWLQHTMPHRTQHLEMEWIKQIY
jgi:5'-nucleotidase